MFIRIKTTPKSPRKSVQICESVRRGDSIRQILVRHIGIANNEQHLIELKKLAEHVKRQIEEERYGPSLFPLPTSEDPPLPTPSTEVVEGVNEEKIVQDSAEQKQMVDLTNLFEQRRVVEGFHDIFGQIFRELGFNQILPQKQSEVLRDVLLARIAMPTSKHRAQEILAADFGRDIPLDRIYRMLDALLLKKDAVQKQVFSATQSLFAEQVNIVFFDVTTLYFESTEEDELRTFGYSKDQKFHMTQVVLALATNMAGLPVGYRLFPGNTAEVKTLLACLDEWKKILPIGEVFLVADRAMMSEANLAALENAQIKYVIAAKLKKMPPSIRKQILEKNGEALLFEEELVTKREFTLSNQRRLVVTHSPKREKKDRLDRERIVEKIQKRIGKSKNVKQLISNRGYSKFLKSEGEAELVLNADKISEEALWDGLHGVITNDTTSKSEELLARYRRLWVIEESFRIHKHHLAVRPIYHFKPERIEAHILLCYMAFTLVRHSAYRIDLQQKKLYPEPLENWNLDSAKAPAVRSIAKRSVLMQYGPLCDRRTPGLWRSRNSNLLTARGIM